jgi:S1-C subfamily serine protease
MGNGTQSRWAWAPIAIALLVIGLVAWLPAALDMGRIAMATSASPADALAQVSPAATLAPAMTVSEQQLAFDAFESQVIAIYDAASPAVVNVTNRSYVTYRWMGTVPEEGTGSGFVYDTQGHIITNYHVIEDADELLVTLANGQVYAADVVGADPTNDLAVIHVDAGQDLPEPLTLGDSDGLKVGQSVLAIGNPYGLQQTLTTGVVSALGRVIESPENDQFIGEAIQTDAAINPGNSGGPLLDLQGHVIGVNSQIISPSGASAGIGFAVSANTVRRVVPQLIEHGAYAHPWLGADMIPLNSSLVTVLRDAGVDLAVDSGLLVLDTAARGPAQRAGVQAGDRWLRLGRYQLPVGGDIIVAIDGVPTADLETLTVYLETETSIGDTVELTINRSSQEVTLPVVLGEQP